jgi:hypothetical protein
MPPLQTVYRDNQPAYSLGRRVNMEEWNTATFVNTQAAAIAFGVPVVADGAEIGCKNLTAAGENILGITEADLTVGGSFAQTKNVPVCEIGCIAVELGANVTRGAQARFDLTAKKWTGAAASATVMTIPGAQFDEAGVSGQLGVVRYRRPVPSLSVGA